MTINRVDTTRPEYSWIPFFEELAQNLHKGNWRKKQWAIVDKLQEMKGQMMTLPNFVNQLDNWIDPFSVMALVRRNKITLDNQQQLMAEYKDFFEIDAGLPIERPFAPTADNRRSFYVPGSFGGDEVDPHWDTLGYVIDIGPSNLATFDERLAEFLNRSLQVTNVGIPNLTSALYCINPHRYLKDDTVDYVLGHGWGLNDVDFGSAYLRALERVRVCDARPFPLVNNEAWLVGEFTDNPDAFNLWMVAAGIGNVYSEDFLAGGFSAIGWEHDLDSAEFETAQEMRDALKPIWPTSADQIARFHKDIKRGDVIVMRTRESGGLRYGFVASDSTYFAGIPDMNDQRGVYWRQTDIRMKGLSLPRRNTVARIREARDAVVKRIMQAEGLTIEVAATMLESHDDIPPLDIQWPSDEVFLSDVDQLRMLKLLRRKQNLILQGPPGTGKTFIAKRLAYALMGERADDRIASVQFHQSYSYEDFVGGYRPSTNHAEQLVFKPEDGAFLRLCDDARKDPDNEYVMLIDEINRGNLSRVFGELLMLIESDKRNSESAVVLQHLKARGGDGKFYVPPNVYIIGTMNLADRSLTGMNVAMRRRFAFRELTPQFESDRFKSWIADSGMPDEMQVRIRERMAMLNQSITADSSLGKQYAVGHSFFCPGQGDPEDGDWEAWYQAVIEHEIRPLLEEYWFDQPERAQQESDRLLAN